MPTSTDLVTDLPADFEVFGQAVDTQMKTNSDAAIAKSIVTTKGDLIAATGTSTPARLGVGTNDQVLTADSTAAAGVKWAAVPNEIASQTGNSGKYLTTDGTTTSWGAIASSGAVFINRTSFTASSAVTIDNLFSTTYENYLVSVQVYGSNAGASIRMQGRYGTTTHTGSNYQTVLYGLNYASATLNGYRTSGVGNWTFGEVYTTANSYSTLNFVVYRPSSSSWLGMTGDVVDQNNGTYYSGGANIQSNQDWSGLYLYPSAGTLTGQISVYGLAKS